MHPGLDTHDAKRTFRISFLPGFVYSVHRHHKTQFKATHSPLLTN